MALTPLVLSPAPLAYTRYNRASAMCSSARARSGAERPAWPQWRALYTSQRSPIYPKLSSARQQAEQRVQRFRSSSILFTNRLPNGVARRSRAISLSQSRSIVSAPNCPRRYRTLASRNENAARGDAYATTLRVVTTFSNCTCNRATESFVARARSASLPAVKLDIARISQMAARWSRWYPRATTSRPIAKPR